MIDKKTLVQLENLNLSPNEAKVYLSLLQIGQTSAGKIIKMTRLHRSVVYETLDKLINRKLIFKITKKKIAHFQALSPDRLLEDSETQLKTAQSLVPHLKSLLNEALPEITVYEGIESYAQYWLDSLQRMPEGSTDYVAGSIGSKWATFMGEKRMQQYFDTAKRRKISWQLIVFDKQDYDQHFLKNYPGFHWDARLIDKPVSKDGNFNILGDDILVLHSTAEPMVIEIKNESLVRVFRNIFDVLWDSGKKIPNKL